MTELNGVNQDRQRASGLRPEGEISRRELLKLASPFGKLELNSSRCSGCGLCALDCPTGALSFSEGGKANAYLLLFKHNLCFACGQCIEICPEQCLHLERTLELDKLSSPATVLFEDEMIRCSECGGPVGSRRMINKIGAKVLAIGEFSPGQFELCPTCKAGAQFSYAGSPGANKTHQSSKDTSNGYIH